MGIAWWEGTENPGSFLFLEDCSAHLNRLNSEKQELAPPRVPGNRGPHGHLKIGRSIPGRKAPSSSSPSSPGAGGSPVCSLLLLLSADLFSLFIDGFSAPPKPLAVALVLAVAW